MAEDPLIRRLAATFPTHTPGRRELAADVSRALAPRRRHPRPDWAADQPMTTSEAIAHLDVGRVLNPSAAAKQPPFGRPDGLRTRPTKKTHTFISGAAA